MREAELHSSAAESPKVFLLQLPQVAGEKTTRYSQVALGMDSRYPYRFDFLLVLHLIPDLTLDRNLVCKYSARKHYGSVRRFPPRIQDKVGIPAGAMGSSSRTIRLWLV